MPASSPKIGGGRRRVSSQIYAKATEIVKQERIDLGRERLFQVLNDHVMSGKIFSYLSLADLLELPWVNSNFRIAAEDYLLVRKNIFGHFSNKDPNLRDAEDMGIEFRLYNNHADRIKKIILNPPITSQIRDVALESLFFYIHNRIPSEESQGDIDILEQYEPLVNRLVGALRTEGRVISALISRPFPKTDPRSLMAASEKIVSKFSLLRDITINFIAGEAALDPILALATEEGRAKTKEELADRIKKAGQALDDANLPLLSKARLYCYLMMVAYSKPEELSDLFEEGLGYLKEGMGYMFNGTVRTFETITRSR